ncbi:N-acetylglucosamine-6-phosphate deacetylase [Gymnodinialimonas sp. 2305UL16-5]|uniref:N-acetylglucosamine-6-phosphate deacetylase n=1 Tax=Gymnodinialimonas mytili TaxID=3126503 RepID=UPI0030B0AD55
MLIGARFLWSGGALARDMAVDWQDGAVRAVRPLGGDTPDRMAHLIMPCLTDLQVNGGGGVLFNADPTPEGLDAIADAHGQLGTGALLPTVITDTAEVMEAAADAVRTRRDDPRILGIHLEGPHIAEARRGTHDAGHIRPLDAWTVTLVEALRNEGIRVKITLAPEMAPLDLLTRLVDTGALVSIGHSAASAKATRAALAAGAGCFTHLYNAMPPMTSRDPGLLGVALNADCPAGIIADGIHVDWDMLRIAVRARPGPTFAVSDAMPTVGGPDHFTLYGRRIEVQEGRLVNDEGSLAGAHIDMAQSLANLAGPAGLPLDLACAMVSDRPRAALGLPPQIIAPEGEAFLCFDAEFERMVSEQ